MRARDRSRTCDLLFTSWPFTCGVCETGTLECWGADPVEGPPAGEFTQVDVSEVISAPPRACAVRVDGAVVCWGNNDFAESDIPEGEFVEVSVRGSDTCGLLVDATVVCWGAGRAAPVRPSGQFAKVFAGAECGLRFDGTFACWKDYWFRGPQPPDGEFIQVSVGGHYACALGADGGIACWNPQDASDAEAQRSGEGRIPAAPFVWVAVGGRRGLRRRGRIRLRGEGLRTEARGLCGVLGNRPTPVSGSTPWCRSPRLRPSSNPGAILRRGRMRGYRSPNLANARSARTL